MCEDCLLAKLAWFRYATPDTEAGSIWRQAKENKRPIQRKLMDIDNQVYEVDRLVVDELRELDIFYEGRKFGT